MLLRQYISLSEHVSCVQESTPYGVSQDGTSSHEMTVDGEIETFETINLVVIAPVFHLFPFRTEKLSPVAPMVLQCNVGE